MQPLPPLGTTHQESQSLCLSQDRCVRMHLWPAFLQFLAFAYRPDLKVWKSNTRKDPRITTTIRSSTKVNPFYGAIL